MSFGAEAPRSWQRQADTMAGVDVVYEGRGDVRRHAHTLCHRSGRPSGSRATLAAGLRRAASSGRPEALPRKAGQTLQATALVHEAYIRLVDVEKAQHWNSRGHFFAAAAEAMRRILVENARDARNARSTAVVLSESTLDRTPSRHDSPPDQLLAWTKHWTSLPKSRSRAAELVKLRFFAGLSIDAGSEGL